MLDFQRLFADSPAGWWAAKAGRGSLGLAVGAATGCVGEFGRCVWGFIDKTTSGCVAEPDEGSWRLHAWDFVN